MDGLAIKESVRTGDADRVSEALDPDRHSGQTVLWALEIVRERKLAAAFDRVVALLESPDRDVRETAIGVLMDLGDPRGVAPIADATDPADPVAVRIAIDAAARLGGEDARTFLEFLRDHPSDGIGEAAAAALEELSAVSGQPSAGKPGKTDR
jgi:HEAT repeat protein